MTLIGSGLTAVDVLLRLRELGYRGTITTVSRHGVFPKRHAAYTPSACVAIPAGTPANCLAYLRALRIAVAGGTCWRAAVDSLRANTNALWLALSLREQKRFRRHLQRRWDVVRHRMAPPIADIIEAELASGTLLLGEGHLQCVAARPGGATLSLKTPAGVETVQTTRVINCTGPNMNYCKVNSPLLKNLFARGVASAGPLSGGMNTTRFGALISCEGKASRLFFNVGPGRLGTLLESIAIPEIRQQAVEVATIIAGRVHAGHRQSIHWSPNPSTVSAMVMA